MQVPRAGQSGSEHGHGRGDHECEGSRPRGQRAGTHLRGQHPVITRAKKSIATFKLREGMPIGCMVTLRKERMFEFLDRFINAALPRIRDFKGSPTKSFDGRGKLLSRIKEQVHLSGDRDRQGRLDPRYGYCIVTTARPMKKYGRCSVISVCRQKVAGWRQNGKKIIDREAKQAPKFKVRAYHRCPLLRQITGISEEVRHVPQFCFRRTGRSGERSRAS